MAQTVAWDWDPKARIEHGCVAFQNVSLALKDGKTVVKNLSCEIKCGELVALVGQSGSGKSSILDLTNGLNIATTGRITVDGKDLGSVSREDIGTVPQKIQLMDGTISENVGYAKLAATSEEIKEACRAAALHEKIMSFPNQYETRIGSDGRKLSGGECQRIDLARLFLMKPRIILLDEATSSLDAQTEAKVLLSLESLMDGRTTIMVSHRLATVRKAHKILLIETGTVREQGTHDELIKAKGKYCNLWKQQTGSVKL